MHRMLRSRQAVHVVPLLRRWPLKFLGFSREMSGHMITMIGQWQTQAEAQRLDAQAREQMFWQMKSDTEAANIKREQALLKMVEANTSLQREKLKFDMNRKLEFQQIQEKENVQLLHNKN